MDQFKITDKNQSWCECSITELRYEFDLLPSGLGKAFQMYTVYSQIFPNVNKAEIRNVVH